MRSHITDLCILPGNLDLINFTILKLSQIMTERIERLDPRPRIYQLLISVAPLLQPLYVFIVIDGGFLQEVFLVFFLLRGVRGLA